MENLRNSGESPENRCTSLCLILAYPGVHPGLSHMFIDCLQQDSSLSRLIRRAYPGYALSGAYPEGVILDKRYPWLILELSGRISLDKPYPGLSQNGWVSRFSFPVQVLAYPGLSWLILDFFWIDFSP